MSGQSRADVRQSLSNNTADGVWGKAATWSPTKKKTKKKKQKPNKPKKKIKKKGGI